MSFVLSIALYEVSSSRKPDLVNGGIFNTQISLDKSSEKGSRSTFKAKPSPLGGTPYRWDKLRSLQEKDKDSKKQNGKLYAAQRIYWNTQFIL